MNLKKKNLLIISVVLIMLVVISYWLVAVKTQNKKSADNISPTEAVIPTIDNSVKVNFASIIGRQEMALNINNIPLGTNSIDYELSYQTRQQGLQGVIGTISPSGKSSYEKKITLGTCSSGKCVYHEVVGKIKLTLKFSGDYGERLFEKEFEI